MTSRRARAARQRSLALAASVASTVVVFGLVAWLVSRSEYWPAVRRQFFSWEDIRASFPDVLRGFWLNVRIWLIAQVFILIVSLVLAVMRSLHGPLFAPLRVFAIVYIDVVRGIPSLLLILLFGFGVPALQIPGLPTSALFWGTVAMIAGYSAYTAEVFRAGMDAVHDSQRMAARALGLSQAQTLRHAVLPQAVRNVLPALLNGSVSLQKDVALLSIIGVRDAVREAQIYTARTFNYSSLIGAAVLFLLASIPLARFTDSFARRDRERRTQAILWTRDPRIEIAGLTKAFGAHRVIDGVDLTVAEHEVVCLIGASGSGKSTLLRCVDRLVDWDQGTIRLDGVDIDSDLMPEAELRRRVGIVFQAYNLFPHMTVLDNVTLAPRKVHRTDRAAAEADARRLLELFGMGAFADSYPDRLSGGQQQRVAIVRAMATNPDVLLLDEVTAALDPELIGGVLSVIRDLREAGMTMLIVTHEMGFARDSADRVCFLDAGRIVEEGPPDQLFGDPHEARTRQFLQRIIEAGRL